MADFLTDKPTSNKLERAFLIGVQTHAMPAGEADELLLELKELVENLRISVVRSTLVNLRQPTPAMARIRQIVAARNGGENAKVSKLRGAPRPASDKSNSIRGAPRPAVASISRRAINAVV